MNINKKISLFFSVLIIFCTFTACTPKKDEQPQSEPDKFYTKNDFTEEQLDCSEYDVNKYTIPFWESNIVYNECVYPIMNTNDELAPFELMYYIDEIVSVKNCLLDVTYVEGKDYILEDGKLRILPEGDILVKMQEDIHQKSNPFNYSINYMYPHKDGNGFEYWNDYDIFSRSLFVTYIHNDSWNGPKQPSMAEKLPKTMQKLNSREKLVIVVTGDSISVGYNSSKIKAKPPFADGYALMSVKALREKYHNNIMFVNSAIGGSTAKYDDELLDKTVLRYNPSLVIIAYGMNDATNGVSTEEYYKNIDGRISYIKDHLPDCEILLVTSFASNEYVFDTSTAKDNAAALYLLSEKYDGVGICDPYAVQSYLMDEKGKEFLCFMGDNLVHPNDYGMRIIAQCVLSALEEQK